ncbi:MAG: LysE family transporter [Chloroflexi bacterium]|nr:LysE family transporter [Chloroflexota bacterium]
MAGGAPAIPAESEPRSSLEQQTIVAVFLTSFGVGFSGAAAPGPLLAFTIRESVRSGFRAGPLVSAGHVLLELPLVVGLAWGLGGFLNRDPVVAGISLAGGAFLLWMGGGLVLRPGSHLPEADRDGVGAGGLRRTVFGGVVISLVNPFWTIWWATIGLGFLAWAQESGRAGVGAFYVGHALSDFAWYTFVAVAVASGGRVMGPRLYRGLLVGCGVFLIGLGVWFLVVGAQHLVAIAAK